MTAGAMPIWAVVLTSAAIALAVLGVIVLWLAGRRKKK